MGSFIPLESNHLRRADEFHRFFTMFSVRPGSKKASPESGELRSLQVVRGRRRVAELFSSLGLPQAWEGMHGGGVSAGPKMRVDFRGSVRVVEVVATRPSAGDPTATEYYVHYDGLDRRLDEWVPADRFVPESEGGDGAAGESGGTSGDAPTSSRGSKRGSRSGRATGRVKRKRGESPARDSHHSMGADGEAAPRATGHGFGHGANTKVRNVHSVQFGPHLISCWYFSPYPRLRPSIGVGAAAAAPTPAAAVTSPTAAAPATATGASRGGDAATAASANGSGATSVSAPAPAARAATAASAKGEEGGDDDVGASKWDAWDDTRRCQKLFVCEHTFKYMSSEKAFARHSKRQLARGGAACRPPGRQIYRDPTHSPPLCVFEVDGETEPLYCQNLCLFSKLFIEHKTLYYDPEPFLFYVLGEEVVDPTAPPGALPAVHAVGYFSKEKISHGALFISFVCSFSVLLIYSFVCSSILFFPLFVFERVVQPGVHPHVPAVPAARLRALPHLALLRALPRRARRRLAGEAAQRPRQTVLPIVLGPHDSLVPLRVLSHDRGLREGRRCGRLRRGMRRGGRCRRAKRRRRLERKQC